MKYIKMKLVAPFEIMHLILKYSPQYFIFFVPQVVCSAFLPLLYVYVPKLIIEALTNNRAYLDIIKIIVTFCAMILILNLVIGYLDKNSSYTMEKFSNKLLAEIGQYVMNLNLSEIGNSSLRDSIRLAGNAVGTIEIFEIIKNFIKNTISLMGFVIIIAKLNMKFFALVTGLLAVKIVFTSISYKANIKLRLLSAQNDRHGNYLTNICYFNQGSAKEIRVNSIQHWFLQKVHNYRYQMLKFQYIDFRRFLIFDSINAILYAISSFHILISLSTYYLEGIISIADFTLYFTAISAIITTLGTITDLTAQYNSKIQSAADFGKLKNLSKQTNELFTWNNEPFEMPTSIEITFSDVWFAYPGSEDCTLRGVNINITNREKLVIVGYNGAGKSTFIKLLCKFYRPTKGKITLNGKDIWEIPNEQYHRMLGAVFQDFATLAFTISENISMSEKSSNLSEVMLKAGISDFVMSLENGENTYISKIFATDGIELSGGQGQKIALARSLYKNTPILILDEPTASLDMKAESELYESFMNLGSDKTAIFISHRLAASQIADHIAVFSDGKIVEYGSHKDLIVRNGIYADMFNKQSMPYVQD